MSNRKIEILHKQLKQVMVLLTQKLKMSVDVQGSETRHSKQKKKVSIYHNAILVEQWITNFDTKNINDCFYDQMNIVPTEIERFEKDN